jgi:hypothetical protein
MAFLQSKGSSFTGESVGEQLSATTDAAVAEGKSNVAAAQSAASGYVDQAKGLANTAINTAGVSIIRVS